jgi:DNA polymerase-3 subunit epsilon
MMYPELLWVFSQLPDHYVVLDTETTGLPDEKGLPDIITLGITVVNDRNIIEATEFSIRPQRTITKEAEAIHGISNEQASGFKLFDSQWPEIAEIFHNQLVVIHNASFDWTVLLDYLKRYRLEQPKTIGVFCSQKAAIPWAQANNLECSYRGPSLDTLTTILEVEDLRDAINGVHGAKIDSQQTACVVEKLRRLTLLLPC